MSLTRSHDGLQATEPDFRRPVKAASRLRRTASFDHLVGAQQEKG